MYFRFVGALSAVAVSGLVLFPRAREPFTPPSLTSVTVFDDRLEPVEGGVVILDDGSQERVFVTDADGQTPWLIGTQPPGFKVTFGEQKVKDGTLVGMRQDVAPPYLPSPGDDYYENVIQRTQPVARRHHLAGEAQAVATIAEGFPHWYVVSPPGSQVRFTADIASLLDTAMAEEYFDYRGHTPATEYARGVVLILPDLQLGVGPGSGFHVGFKLLGALPDDVAVDAYNFIANPNVGFPGPSLSVTMDAASNNDHVVVTVRGTVRGGHLALLARSASEGPGQLYSLNDNAPDIEIPADAGEGVEVAFSAVDESDSEPSVFMTTDPRLVVDCEPTAPSPPPDWDCAVQPQGGGSSPGCPPCTDTSGSAGGSHQCAVRKMKGPRFCRSPGAMVGRTIGTTREFKVSFGVTESGEEEGIKSEGGFTYGVSSQSIHNEAWTD